MTDVQTAYQRERQAAIDLLRRTFGENAIIPLELVAAVLPVLPEYRRKKSR